jgi:site-specific DNA-cytosine methylase
VFFGVDLFADAGGQSLGFEQASFDVVAAVVVDLIHSGTPVQTVHQFNFPGRNASKASTPADP